ncbi:MAG: serine hydrolase domain-containing protein [Vulcanimicrobiota bacterium]
MENKINSKNMAIIFLLFSILISGCSTEANSNSSSIPKERLQATLNRVVNEYGMPGVLMGIKTPDETWIASAGVANLDTGEPMTKETQFRLASITKPFTAILVMQLVEEGKLSLDNTLEDLLPGKVPNGENITVSMLLNHTSGIYDYENSFSFNESIVENCTHEWTEEQVLSFFVNEEPYFEPGTSWKYSNSNYYLLGMIIEKVTGNQAEPEFQNRILDPLGMTRTRISKSGYLDGVFTPGYAFLFDNPNIQSIGNWNYSWDWTAGCGVSTVEDMLKFPGAFYKGELVSPQTRDIMLTPLAPSSDYGYGWSITTPENHLVNKYMIDHSGENPGTSTNLSYSPDYDITFFTVINRLDMYFENGEFNIGNNEANVVLIKDILDYLNSIE